MYLPEFKEYLIHERNYSPHTVLAYLVDVQEFAEYLEGKEEGRGLDEVLYSDIRSWIIHLVNHGIANRTINRKIASLKAYYKFIQRIEIREDTPLAYHQPLKVEAKLRVPFSQKEMQAVLEQEVDYEDFRSVRDLLIIALLYATGIRRAELISLEVNAVQLHDRKMRVIGKGGKERWLPLLPWCVELLEEYLKLRQQIPNATLTKYLLLTEKGKPVYPSLVYTVVRNAFKSVSAKQIKSPHIIRHTFATHLLDEGADLIAIKELLGHTSLASTQVYTHNSMKKLKRVYHNAHPRNKK